MTDLLSCPFCGGAPEEHWPNSTTKHFIQCGSCGARTSINLASHGGSARDEWNRRAPVSALPGEVEVVATAWKFHGKQHVDLMFAPDPWALERGLLTDIEPLVPLASLQAMQARAEAAEEANKALMEERTNMIATHQDSIDRLDAEVKKQMRRATDAEYMGRAYRNMLGAKGSQVAKIWDDKGVKRVHHSWGPEAAALSGEERAQVILDMEIAAQRAVPMPDIDAHLTLKGGSNG